MAWQDRTENSVRWLQEIFSLADPPLSQGERLALFAEARLLTVAQQPSADKFFGVFINTVRTLVVGGDPRISVDKLFKGQKREEPEERDEQCPNIQRQGRRRFRCVNHVGHAGRCDYAQEED